MLRKEEIKSGRCRKRRLPATIRWMNGKWLLLLDLVAVLTLIVTPALGQKEDGVIKDTLQRPKNDPLVQLAIRRPALKPKERRRISKRLRSIKEDIQILIGDSVDANFTPKEMANKIIEIWQESGSMSPRGIVILLDMEQHRIEIAFGQGLTHMLDEDWCNEVAYTKMVPWFRKDDYAKGLEEAITEIEATLRATKNPKKWKNRLKWVAGLYTLFEGWRHRRQLRQMIGRRFRPDDDAPPSPPPEGPGGIGIRRRPRRRLSRRSQREDFWSPQNWEDFGRSFRRGKLLRLIDIFIQGPTGSYKGNGGQTTVNVFYPPAPERHQSPTETTPPSSPTETQQQKTKVASPPKVDSSLPRTAFLGKPEPFRPLAHLGKMPENKPSCHQTLKTPVKSPSKTGSCGGASWSTVTDRSSKEASTSRHPLLSVVSAQRPIGFSKKQGLGGGASWSHASERKTKNSEKKTAKQPNANKKSVGGGASWSNANHRAKSTENNAPKSSGGGASW